MLNLPILGLYNIVLTRNSNPNPMQLEWFEAEHKNAILSQAQTFQKTFLL